MGIHVGNGVLQRDDLALLNLGAGRVHIGFGPGEIVEINGHKIGDGDSYRIFDRAQMPRGHLGFEPFLLVGGKPNVHSVIIAVSLDRQAGGLGAPLGVRKLRELRAGALIVGTDAFLFGQRDRIAALAIRHGIPAIYDRREYAAASAR